MKVNKIILAISAVSLALGGCHGDLDIMQDNKLSASNMWKDESDATTSTYAVYLYMRDAFKSVHDTYLCWGEFRNGLWGPGTGNTLSSVDQTQVRISTMSSGNTYASWTELYTAINQANLVLKYVPGMKISDAASDFCLGNAHFARAWCYFWIARIWGEAPMPTWGYESAKDDYLLPRIPIADIMAQVERDITDAENHVKDPSDKCVATPEAVQMLKAEYALWMYRVLKAGDGYLTMAASAINSLGLTPSNLETDYARVFSSENKLGREVIFAIHQEKGEAVNGPAYYLGWNSNYVSSAYQNNPVPITGGQQWWWYTDRYKALLTEEPSDSRTKLTLVSGEYGAAGQTIEWTEKSMGFMDGTNRVFDSDFILYRYAEAYLLDAEIKYYQKNYSGALSSLNVIAERAYGLPNYHTDQTPSTVRRLIIDENLKELVAEGRTWWMLVRMDAIWDYNSHIAEKRVTNPNILLWPITQKSMNGNSKLRQTDGWY